LELKVPPPLQAIIVAIVMLALTKFVPIFYVSIPAKFLIAVVIAICGLTLSVLGVVAFRSAQTTIDPRYPENSKCIVDSGVYKISRNPMYLGLTVILFAWAIVLESLVAMLILPLFIWYINTFQIKPEERALLKKFNSEYGQYCSRVRRWL